MPSEALEWMDENLEEALLSPDEAFDYVFMLKESDWPLLKDMYDQKPAPWREACAYVFASGPIGQSKSILIKALGDHEKKVREQAAETICYQLKEYSNEAKFEHQILRKVRKTLFEASNSDPSDLKVVAQFLG